MPTTIPLAEDKRRASAAEIAASGPGSCFEVSLLTGGSDRPYVYGLTMALAASGVHLDVIGNAETDSPEMHNRPTVNHLNLYWNPRLRASLAGKIRRVLAFYGRLIRYAFLAKPKIFHILWNNKILLFDRTLLMLYYKLLGKKVVFTAHNVNAARRDANDSALNRLSLRIQYRLADHIFVHTEKMKHELVEEYGVHGDAVTVIPFGINNSVPDTQLTPLEARRHLRIGSGDQTILFFGRIRPYKGAEHVVAAFQRIAPKHPEYRLIMVGEPKKESEQYLRDLQEMIARDPSAERVTQRFEFVPDSETEIYFKAADVLVLPYTDVFQSGVLFLAYSFGLPTIASDVGSFRDDIVIGQTGYICRPGDSEDLAQAIETYFSSDLYKNLDRRRQTIRDFANSRNSWNAVSESTCKVYERLLDRS